MKLLHKSLPPLRDRMKAALFDWLRKRTPSEGIAATLTFDPKRGNGHRFKHVAEATFMRFMAELNRRVYRNALYRFGKQLSVIPVLEGGGSTHKHYHYHAIIGVPAHIPMERFTELLEEVWKQQPAAGGNNCLAELRDSGWLDYMLKDRDKDDLFDAIDIRNLWLNKITPLPR